MNDRLKRIAEQVLLRGGAASIAQRTRRGRTLVLAYHNIVTGDRAGSGERSLHLPRSQFANQLDVLMKCCDVIPVAALSGHSGSARPSVVVTFDDAYAGALGAGVDELIQRKLPGTIFVASGSSAPCRGGISLRNATAAR